jgi:molecular chaperone DnaK (HSP70)
VAIALCAALGSCGPDRERAHGDGIVVEQDSPAIGGKALVESVGIETLGGAFTVLLESGRSVPCEMSNVFSTATDQQASILITLYRGRAQLVRDAHRIGGFRVTGFPLAQRGIPEVDVRIVARGRDLVLVAQVKATGEACRVERVD